MPADSALAKVSLTCRRRPKTTVLAGPPRTSRVVASSSRSAPSRSSVRSGNTFTLRSGGFHRNRVSTRSGAAAPSGWRRVVSRGGLTTNPGSSSCACVGVTPAADASKGGSSRSGGPGSRSVSGMVPSSLVLAKADRSTLPSCSLSGAATGPRVRERALTGALGLASPPPRWLGSASGRSLTKPTKVCARFCPSSKPAAKYIGSSTRSTGLEPPSRSSTAGLDALSPATRIRNRGTYVGGAPAGFMACSGCGLARYVGCSMS